MKKPLRSINDFYGAPCLVSNQVYIISDEYKNNELVRRFIADNYLNSRLVLISYKNELKLGMHFNPKYKTTCSEQRVLENGIAQFVGIPKKYLIKVK